MYYIDGTRYDQVSWYNPDRYQEYQVDGTDPVLPGVLVNGTTGLIPSPVCSGERDDGARYLVPSFLPGVHMVPLRPYNG